MAQTFAETFNDIRANISNTKSGAPIRTFSRADFDRLATAFLNEVDYKVDVAKVKAGELSLTPVHPVQEFRKSLRTILLDFGVDKQDAERIMTADYEITKVDGLYEICSELVYQYAALKKFDFLPRETFNGSLTVKEVGESVSTHKHIQTKEEYKVKKKPHQVLERKSKTPTWLKEKM